MLGTGKWHPEVKRICYACGSTKTQIERLKVKFGITLYEHWYINKPTDLFLCKECYKELFHLYTKEHLRRRFVYKNKVVSPGFVVHRVGVCNWCRSVVETDCKQTKLHHDEDRYEDDDKLANTIELCNRCHNAESARLRKLKEQRSCYSCGDKNPRGKGAWLINRPFEQYLCHLCYLRLRRGTKLVRETKQSMSPQMSLTFLRNTIIVGT